MSKFYTPLRIEHIAIGKWRLTADLRYSSDILGRTVLVPEGFTTDLASVPRIPFAYWLTGGRANAAAVIHDWFYSSHEVDRATADAVFREAIAVEGHGWFTRWAMWAGVRIGGGFLWDKPNLPQPPGVDLTSPP